MRARAKATTTTTLVLNALRRADDFKTAAQLCAMTGQTANRVFAALHHLRRHRVIDSVISGNSPWWFFVGDDTRHRTVDERAIETRQRRPRKSKRKRP